MAITAWNGKSTWKNLQISNCSEELTSDSRERNFVTGCLLWVGSWGCCNACNSFSAILQADLCVFLLEKVHWPQLDSHAWFASSRFWVSFCKSHMLHVWYIYLHLPPKLPSFVGRCSSTMISPWFPHDSHGRPGQPWCSSWHTQLSWLCVCWEDVVVKGTSAVVDGRWMDPGCHIRRLFVSVSVTFDGVGSTKFFEVMLVEWNTLKHT